MSDTTIAFLRAILTVVVLALLNFLADASNIASVIPPAFVGLVTALAAAGVAALDHAKSPTGTIMFGGIGKQR